MTDVFESNRDNRWGSIAFVNIPLVGISPNIRLPLNEDHLELEE